MAFMLFQTICSEGIVKKTWRFRESALIGWNQGQGCERKTSPIPPAPSFSVIL